MIVCWSTKGGVGTTVVASVLALELGRNAGSAVLADLRGDVATVLGAEPGGERAGLNQWLSSLPSVPLDASRRLLVEVSPELQLLPPGAGVTEMPEVGRQSSRLADAFLSDNLVVDAGVVGDESSRALIDASTRSIIVLRACFLAVKRASEAKTHADGFVLIEEAGRSLDSRDVEDVIGVPNLATIAWDPAVARLVDAGRMKSRLPRSLRPLQRLAESLTSEARRAG